MAARVEDVLSLWPTRFQSAQALQYCVYDAPQFVAKVFSAWRVSDDRPYRVTYQGGRTLVSISGFF